MFNNLLLGKNVHMMLDLFDRFDKCEGKKKKKKKKPDTSFILLVLTGGDLLLWPPTGWLADCLISSGLTILVFWSLIISLFYVGEWR